MESLFSWNIPDLNYPIEQFIKAQTEKCENIEEENKFKWTSFTLHILLAYELCDKMGDFTKALEHINTCLQHLDTLTKDNCKEKLFSSIKAALWHVTIATKTHIMLKAGQHYNQAQDTTVIKTLNQMNTREKSGLLGIKAGVLIQYGTKGHRLALVCAEQARNLDPNQAEWWFINGNVMGRLRRIENGSISEDEINFILKAMLLEKNATYIVHLGELYAEYSTYLMTSNKGANRRENIDKSKSYATKAVALLKEGIEIRPNCASMMARVAHALLRVYFKDILDIKFIKELLDTVVIMTPRNKMAYHDLGFYYQKFENNIEMALYNLNQSNELGNKRALTHMTTLKWKHGLRNQIISDLQKGLNRYTETENQADLSVALGVFYLLIESDWASAVKSFNKSLQVDPSGRYFLNFSGVYGKKINMLELITNELRLKLARGQHFSDFQMFLKIAQSIQPELFKNVPTPGKFENWKREMLKIR